MATQFGVEIRGDDLIWQVRQRPVQISTIPTLSTLLLSDLVQQSLSATLMLGRNAQAVLRGSGQPPSAQHIASSATHCLRTNTQDHMLFNPSLGCSSSAMSPYSTPYSTRLTAFAPRHHLPRKARAMSSTSGENSASPKPKKSSKALSLLSVPGIGPKNESMFKSKGIHNIEDLELIHFNKHKADSDMTRGFVEVCTT
eukprot:gene1890-33304_t